MFPPAHLVQLPSMATNETLAALAARLQAPPSGELPLPDASLASMAPVVPFDVQALAESLTAVLAAPLPSGAVSHTAPKTTHSKHRASGRSSSSNTSQGGSLGAISSLSKGTSGSRGGDAWTRRWSPCNTWRMKGCLCCLKTMQRQGWGLGSTLSSATAGMLCTGPVVCLYMLNDVGYGHVVDGYVCILFLVMYVCALQAAGPAAVAWQEAEGQGAAWGGCRDGGKAHGDGAAGRAGGCVGCNGGDE